MNKTEALHPNCRLAALGIVNALGEHAEDIWPRLVAGDTSRLRRRNDLVPDKALLVGEVDAELPPLPSRLSRYDCRNNRLSMAALAQLQDHITAAIERFGAQRIGVVMGTSTSGVSAAESAIGHHQRHGVLAPEFRYEQFEFGGASGFVREYLETRGPAYTLSTACSSGAKAIATARLLLETNVCDAVVAGATDSLCGLTAGGFEALGALSDTGVNCCSKNRDGTVLGEGSAIFLIDRGADDVQLSGVGESSEAYQMAAPDPEGRGAFESMSRALVDAQIEPDAVSYLNLHGTGTPANDSMEAAAVERVFGAKLPVSSTKAATGHLLGAAGATDAAVCWLALDRMSAEDLSLPAHVWDGVHDPEVANLTFAERDRRAPRRERTHVATNSFGFGGTNCTLVLSRG